MLTKVTPTPLTVPPVTARLPPVVVIDTAFGPSLTAPVMVKPPVASFSVKPPELVNAPRLLIWLPALVRATVDPEEPVTVSVDKAAVWLTAPALEIVSVVPTEVAPKLVVPVPVVVVFSAPAAEPETARLPPALIVLEPPSAKTTVSAF